MEQSTSSQLSCLISQSIWSLRKDSWTILFPRWCSSITCASWCVAETQPRSMACF